MLFVDRSGGDAKIEALRTLELPFERAKAAFRALPVAKRAAKPVAKSAAKSAAKRAAKLVSKRAAKSVSQRVAKPVAKRAASAKKTAFSLFEQLVAQVGK
jgi:hypothetical protein